MVCKCFCIGQIQVVPPFFSLLSPVWDLMNTTVGGGGWKCLGVVVTSRERGGVAATRETDDRLQPREKGYPVIVGRGELLSQLDRTVWSYSHTWFVFISAHRGKMSCYAKQKQAFIKFRVSLPVSVHFNLMPKECTLDRWRQRLTTRNRLLLIVPQMIKNVGIGWYMSEQKNRLTVTCTQYHPHDTNKNNDKGR